MIQYIFPTHLIDYFASVALKNFSNNRHVETLCLALGTEAENVITIEELVFPTQTGTTDSVDDKGN